MKMFKDLTCDQVAWMLAVFDRYLPEDPAPRISCQRDIKKYGMLYEIMEVADLKFQDESARHNGTPPQARTPTDRSPEKYDSVSCDTKG